MRTSVRSAAQKARAAEAKAEADRLAADQSLRQAASFASAGAMVGAAGAVAESMAVRVCAVALRCQYEYHLTCLDGSSCARHPSDLRA
eukprot:1008143-Pyramimonas_sp.AAC.1